MRVAADTIGELVTRVRADLGADAVSLDAQRRERLSVDWAHMSPILSARLPAGLADVVVTPRDADEIATVVAHAYDLDVPITARGTGLGNYGQAIPLHGGVLIDVSECRRVLHVDAEAGTVTAEAGVRLRDLEDVLAGQGCELWMYPSTKGSTLGGFLAGGSGGTGSLRHGTNADGFVRALDIASCDGRDTLRHVEGVDTLPFVHAYGTTGIIARASVGIEPVQDWVGLFAAFDDYAPVVAAMRSLAQLEHVPRLISGDEALIVSLLPKDEALDPQRLSLRAILDARTVDDARAVIAAHGGEVLDLRPGLKGSDRVTSLSYNHTTFHMQKKQPDHWFHLEVGGDVLGDRPDDVRAVYAGSVLHLETMPGALGGMLMAPFRSEADVYRGMAELGELGVGIHSPHTWTLDRRIDGIRAVLDEYDPKGLLNPGKLAAA